MYSTHRFPWLTRSFSSSCLNTVVDTIMKALLLGGQRAFEGGVGGCWAPQRWYSWYSSWMGGRCSEQPEAAAATCSHSCKPGRCNKLLVHSFVFFFKIILTGLVAQPGCAFKISAGATKMIELQQKPSRFIRTFKRTTWVKESRFVFFPFEEILL